MCKHEIINGNKNLIISFGGRYLEHSYSSIFPFEFLNYLSSQYKNNCDLIFFIDPDQCWYHNGIKDITKNIDGTVLYINNICKNGNYKKIIFMGTSAGGYAAILFGSICNNITNVISFIPQTIIDNPKNSNYSNLKNIINKNTKYLLYGDTSISDINDLHHISHCENIKCFENVKIIKSDCCNLKNLRDNGFIKNTLDSILFNV